MCYGMVEAQPVCMQAQTVQWVITISVFHISADRMPHLCRMYANLIFSACLKSELHQSVCRCAFENMEVGYGMFSSIIH